MMKTRKYPARSAWPELLQRPEHPAQALDALVQDMMEQVRRGGDAAVLDFSEKYDGCRPAQLQLTAAEWAAGAAATPPELRAAIDLAAANVRTFHAAQQEAAQRVETMPGVVCWRESRPLDRVGLYIPGGTAPLFSTVLMLAIPAALAGCPEILLCSPPDAQGNLHPAILYAAQVTGVTAVYRAGGIQAIAALTHGTESIPAVDKIFGPGNQYVTAAKRAAQAHGLAIDMPAGPSEVLVIADSSARPEWVAADLLSQAEHGADSQVMLLTDSPDLADAVQEALAVQVQALPRRETALEALRFSAAIVLEDLDACLAFSNRYAPEHLILNVQDYARLIPGIRNAGSVFLGPWSCESAGDYASGTNHTLPTHGFARNHSGVSLDSFVKKITFQEISREGLRAIGPAIEIMAAAERLDAHRNAVSIRLQSRNDD